MAFPHKTQTMAVAGFKALEIFSLFGTESLNCPTKLKVKISAIPDLRRQMRSNSHHPHDLRPGFPGGSKTKPTKTLKSYSVVAQ